MSFTFRDEALKTSVAGPTVRTDETGVFEGETLALGSYRLKVEADGHAPAEVSVRLGRAGERRQTTMRLAPR